MNAPGQKGTGPLRPSTILQIYRNDVSDFRLLCRIVHLFLHCRGDGCSKLCVPENRLLYVRSGSLRDSRRLPSQDWPDAVLANLYLAHMVSILQHNLTST
jgi:hypothetical protein